MHVDKDILRTRIRTSVFSNHIFFSSSSCQIHEYLYSDITVTCLHFHMDWCIIHPVDGVAKVVFSDVDLYLKHG